MTALVAGLAFVVALLAVLVIGLLRSHADILRALHDLGVGLDPSDAPGANTGPGPVPVPSPVVKTTAGVPEPRQGDAPGAVPTITGTTPDGGTAVVAISPRPHATLIAFLTTGCTTCAGFWQAFAGRVTLPGADTRLVIVTKGHEHESPAAVARLAPKGVMTLQSSDAWADFVVPGSPYFVLVDGPTGRIVGEGAAASWEQVSGLLDRAVADGALPLTGTDGAPRESVVRSAARREAEVDDALLRAGIGPGHPSLYPGAGDEP